MKNLPNNIDIQRCTHMAGNKFDLILIAAVRARELSRGSKTETDTRHKHTVSALEEIQSGQVGRELLRRVGQRRSR